MVTKARMFQFKPDGEVTLRYAQDGNGMPAATMQDPLHYPHGTKFLAPGPLGQCHPVPDSEGVKSAMATAAAIHARIFESYNIPYDPAPGSLMDKALKHWRRKKARKCVCGGRAGGRRRAGAGRQGRPGCLLGGGGGAGPLHGCMHLSARPRPAVPTHRQRQLDKKLQQEQQRVRRMEEAAAAEEARAGGGKAPAAKGKGKEEAAAPPRDEPPEEEDISDDDLIACTAGMEQQQQGSSSAQQGGPGLPPTVFASVGLGLSRAAVALHRALHEAAVRAPPRRQLTQPQRRA